MGIELYWDDDARTRFLIEVGGAWTWDEMYKVLAAINRETESAGKVLGAIIDLTAGVALPGGTLFSATTFEHARRVLKMGEGGTGPIVIVGMNPLIRTLYDSLAGMDRRATSGIRFAASVEEARRLLEPPSAPRPATASSV